MACFVVLSLKSLKLKKVFNLAVVPLIFFSFMDSALGVIFNNS